MSAIAARKAQLAVEDARRAKAQAEEIAKLTTGPVASSNNDTLDGNRAKSKLPGIRSQKRTRDSIKQDQIHDGDKRDLLEAYPLGDRASSGHNHGYKEASIPGSTTAIAAAACISSDEDAGFFGNLDCIKRMRWFKPVWKSTLCRADGQVKVSNVVWEPWSSSEKPKGSRLTSGQLLICLRPGETVSFAGAAELIVLQGDLTVNDVPLRTGAHERLYCPLTDPLPILTSGSNILRLHELDSHSSILPCPLKENFFSCIIALRPLRRSGLGKLAAICPLAGQDPFCSSRPKELDAADRKHRVGSFRRSFLTLVGAQEAQSGTFSFFHSSVSWRQEWSALRSNDRYLAMEARLVYLVRGSKGAGKSMFARSLLNLLLRDEAVAQSRTRDAGVAYLELDLGQGMSAPPGIISLYHLAPSRQHSAQWPLCSPAWLSDLGTSPVASRFLGQTTPRDIPAMYLSAVRSLAHFYTTHLRGKSVPLVVNTMGWNKGLGAEINAQIEAILRPDQIYDLQALHDPWATSQLSASAGQRSAASSAQALPPSYYGPPFRDALGHETAPGPRVTVVQAVGADLRYIEGTSAAQAQAITAADQRILSILTHLSFRPSKATSETFFDPRWGFGTSLLEQPPYIVDVRIALSGGIHFVPTSEARNADIGMLLATLNAEIVGLVLVPCYGVGSESEVENGSGMSGSTDDPWYHSISRAPPVDAASADFLGLALVRSIDVEAGRLHLLCSPDVFVRLKRRRGEEKQAETLTGPERQPPGPKRRKLAIFKGANCNGVGAADGSSTLVQTPVWAFLDQPSTREAKRGRLFSASPNCTAATLSLAGMTVTDLPYLQWPEAPAENGPSAAVGSEKRRVRRNLMRKAQQ